MKLDRLHQIWRSREPREQRVLAAGAAVCALLLGWALVWHPLDRARQDLSAQLSARQQDLAFLQQAQGAWQQLQERQHTGGASREGKSLLALADASARKAGLGPNIRRLEPLDDKRIRIEYKAADFDTLSGWLADLHRRYGIRADDVSVDRAAGTGQVNARLTLGEP